MPDRTTQFSDTDVLDRYPSTPIDLDSIELYRGWLEERLLINRCSACGHWHHPPAPLCPKCWSTEVVPTEVSGRGTIHLLILARQGAPAPGVDYSLGPHPVATVELIEQPGLRFTSTVIGCEPGDIEIGQRVSLAWIDRGGAPYPVFRPEAADTDVAAEGGDVRGS